MNSKPLFIFLFIFSVSLSFSQKENDSITTDTTKAPKFVNTDTIIKQNIDPLRPAKVTFYSAILPGLGQAYNKKYWKIPIVYAALGTGVYFYIKNDKEYDRYRDAFKRRLAGFTDDEFYGDGTEPIISEDALIRAQQQLRRNKEVSLLVTLGIYALNIIDANVDAHLLQFNVDKNLSLRPHYQYNEKENSSDLGVTFNFKF